MVLQDIPVFQLTPRHTADLAMAFRLVALAALVAALSTSTIAAPVAGNSTESLVSRQLNSANDVVNRICRPTTLLFARGTTELGNMGGVCFEYLDDTVIGPNCLPTDCRPSSRR